MITEEYEIYGDECPPVADAAPKSTGVLLSTKWNQSGVILIGNNTTVAYNEYTPIDPTTSQHSLTGCTNTAAAQIIYYFIEKGLLDLSLTLTAGDAYTSVHGGISITVKADGSTPGTLSFAAVNGYLGSYTLNSATHAAALLYACGVVQQAKYSSDATSTGWSSDLFYRSGFQSADIFYGTRVSTAYFWGNTDSGGNFTISDAGFEVLIENLRAGLPVGASYPGHAVVIDGYDAENDKFHINYGWGKSSSTRWYTRSEMIEQGYHEFIYDLFTERVETLTVTDGRFYGTGTMARAFEQARSILGSNIVQFDAAVAGAAVELYEFTKVQDSTTIRDFNMTVTVTNARNWSWGAAFYGENGSVTTFENFGGALIVNTGMSTNVGFYFGSADRLSLSADHALIYAGSYSVGGSYSAGAAAVLAAMRTARDSGSALASFVTAAAASSCYSVYGSAGDDDVVFTGASLVVGDVNLGSGNDTLTITGSSLVVGDVNLGSGNDTLTITGSSRVEGDVYLGTDSDSLAVLDGSRLYGNISGSGSNTITIDSTSAVSGTFYAEAAIDFVLDSAAADHALFTVMGNVYNVDYYATAITVDIADAEVGSYILFAADAGASYADWLDRLTLTVTGSGEADYTLAGNGTSTSKFADVVYEDRMLKFNVNVAPSDLLPKVVAVAADITSATTGNVTVTASFNANVQTAQYSLDGETWETYISGVVMHANGTVYFRGLGEAGKISEVVSYEVANIIAVDKPTRGDFNGNGISDILFQNLVDPMNPLGAWMDADMWQWNGALGPAAKTDWTVYGAFDFTGDLVCDIMFRSKLAATEYAVGFYDMGEGGTFKTMGWGVTAEWDLAQVGDFNGNGVADILWSNSSTGYHGLWLDGTDEWVALPYSYLTPGVQTVFGVGDVNNDGRDDILIDSAGTLGAWDIAGLLDGTETMPLWTGFGLSLTSDWETVGAADFDGNGSADIVLWNKDSGYVGAYMNCDPNQWTGIFPDASHAEWGIPGFGDYNGDGCDDVLVRNLATGALGYWSGKDNFAWNGIGWGVDSTWAVIA